MEQIRIVNDASDKKFWGYILYIHLHIDRGQAA